MIKRAWPLFAALVLGIALGGPVVQAQSTTVPLTQPFSLTAAQQFSPTLLFANNVSTCSVVVYSGSGFTLVPQVSSDAQTNPSTPTWVTASSINSGSITATGTFTGSIASQGLAAMNVLLTNAGSGQAVTGVITCSGAVAPAPAASGGGGATNATIVAPTNAAGAVIVTTPAPNATVFIANTPGVTIQNTPGVIVVSGVPTATASPPPATGVTQSQGLPVFAEMECLPPSTTPLTIANGILMPVGCAIINGTGTALPIMAATCGLGNTSSTPGALCTGTVSNADGTSNSTTSLPRTIFNLAYNGTTWDRQRKDTYAAGPQWVTSGGSATVSIATGAGNTVVKASAGRLVQMLVTTAGTAALTCYDNATTNTGTIIGLTPTSTSSGTILTFNNPAANGITCAGLSGSPVVTVSYF